MPAFAHIISAHNKKQSQGKVLQPSEKNRRNNKFYKRLANNADRNGNVATNKGKLWCFKGKLLRF